MGSVLPFPPTSVEDLINAVMAHRREEMTWHWNKKLQQEVDLFCARPTTGGYDEVRKLLIEAQKIALSSPQAPDCLAFQYFLSAGLKRIEVAKKLSSN